MEKEIELELPRGEKPKEGKTEMAEKTVELMSGSPLEMKLEEVLGKVTAMESAMTKMTALFEGGAFSGKAGKEYNRTESHASWHDSGSCKGGHDKISGCTATEIRASGKSS